MIDEHVINQYLADNPDASLKDFCEHVNGKRRAEKEAEEQRLKAERDYFNEHYKGKYVRIDFHAQAHTLIGPIPADACYRGGSLSDIECIDVYNSRGTLKIEIGSRPVNYHWLTNPYFVFGCGGGHNVTCTVISEEKYESMKEFANDLIEMTNNKLEEI